MTHFKRLSTLLSENLNIQKGTHIYLLRHGQSIGNHGGSIVGWTDSKLSVKGRNQSNLLFRGIYQHLQKFTEIHSSDLTRCVHTLQISSGFSGISIKKDHRLRQLNFGDQEGVHYDSLPEQRKKQISSLQYKPPNGQTWPQARARAIEYLSNLKKGHHLICCHGGLMCALLYHLGIKKVVPNCSIICAEFCLDTKDLHKLNFVWQFPTDEELSQKQKTEK